MGTKGTRGVLNDRGMSGRGVAEDEDPAADDDEGEERPDADQLADDADGRAAAIATKMAVAMVVTWGVPCFGWTRAATGGRRPSLAMV